MEAVQVLASRRAPPRSLSNVYDIHACFCVVMRALVQTLVNKDHNVLAAMLCKSNDEGMVDELAQFSGMVLPPH